MVSTFLKYQGLSRVDIGRQRAYIRCYKIPNTITTAANLYRTLRSNRERWKSYQGRQINIPSLIIHGTLDPVIIKEYLIGAEHIYPDLIIEHLAGGHFICDEQPQPVGNAVSKFLSTATGNI